MRNLPLLAVALLGAVPCLEAQVDLASLFPTRPLVEFRLRKSKTFLAHLESSKIGKVVTDESMALVWKQLIKNEEIAESWKDFSRRSEENFAWMEMLGKVLHENDMDVRIAGGWRQQPQMEPEWWIAAQFSGPADALTGFADFATKELSKHKVPKKGMLQILGKNRVYVSGGDKSHGVVLPFVHEGSLLLFVGSEGARSFGEKPARAHESIVRERKEPFVLAADLGSLVGMWADGGIGSVDDKDLIQALGMDELRTMEFTLDVESGRIVQGFDFGIPATGVLAEVMSLLASKEGKARELMRHVPEGIQTSDLWTTDPQRLYRAIKTAVDGVSKAADTEAFDFEQEFQNKFGFDLVKGLVDPLDGRFLSSQDFGGPVDPGVEVSPLMMSTTALCVGVKDVDVFGKSIDTVIRKMGLHVGRKKEQYKDVDLFWFKFLGVLEIHYAIVDDLFVVAYGGKPKAMLHKVVDREKDLAAGQPGFVPSSHLADQLSLVSLNPTGLRVADLPTMVGGFAQLLNQFQDLGLSEEEGSMTAIIKAISETAIPLLKKHGVETSITAMGREGRRLRLVSIW